MNRLLILFIILILAIFVMPAVLMERVPPAKIGVKQNMWAGGIVEKDYGTGFHVGITGYHKWYLLDKRTHFVNYSQLDADIGRSDGGGPLEFRTKDNNEVMVDVTVTYRIKEDEAHLIVREGDIDIYRDRVTSTVKGVLREELAQLRSEDFYSTDARLARVTETLPILRQALKPLHVVPLDILVRAMRFPEGYEQKLQDKQLTLQKTKLFEAQEKVENQLQVTGKMEKEIEAAEKGQRGDWDKRLQQARSDNNVKIAGVLAEAEVYDKRVRAEAGAEYETSVAEGRLAMDTAEALRNDLRNRALDTLGGRIFLARQAAENLQIGEVTLNSNDPEVPSIIDVNELVKLLVGD